MNERPVPKFTSEEVRDLLIEGRKLRAEVEKRIREMRIPNADDLLKRVR